MTTFHANNKIISFTKGAPDVLLQRCAMLTKAVQQQVDKMAEEGQRILGFAYRYWDGVPDNTQQ